MSTRKHTTETRQKISDAVKRHYANMSVERVEKETHFKLQTTGKQGLQVLQDPPRFYKKGFG